MRHIPQPTEYLAALYKPATHAPECDTYIFHDDLEQLGIGLTKRGEMRVPFEVNKKFEAMGPHVFCLDSQGRIMVAINIEAGHNG